jgi:transcriptional regulator with XRE-family HTH domain
MDFINRGGKIMSNLKTIRQANNLSQSGLAKKAEVNLRMIQKYEIGEKDINKAQAITLYKIAQVLDCMIEDLLEI